LNHFEPDTLINDSILTQITDVAALYHSPGVVLTILAQSYYYMRIDLIGCPEVKLEFELYIQQFWRSSLSGR